MVSFGMANDFIRNSEGYYDPTAGTAMMNVQREKNMDIKAGDVIKISRVGVYDDRAFAVLAVTGQIFTMIRLQDSAYPKSVPVLCGSQMYAQPEKLEWTNGTRSDISYVRTMTEQEQTDVREAVLNLLDLYLYDREPVVTVRTDGTGEAESINADALRLAEETAQELIREKARADTYKEMYEALLRQCVRA